MEVLFPFNDLFIVYTSCACLVLACLQYPLKMELWTAINHQVGPENQKWALHKNGKYSNYRDHFSSPVKENIYMLLVEV